MTGSPVIGKPWHARSSPLARGACAVYALLVLYSGLTPWRGWRDLGVATFAYLTAPVPRHLTNFDLVVNVLGYMPLGALVVLSLHPRARGALAVLLALVAGALLSGTIEALQTYLPSRVPSNIDLATNSLGALLGGLLAAPFASALIDRGRLADLRLRWFERRPSLLLLLVSLWPLTQVAPEPMLFGSGDLRDALGDAVAALGGTWPSLDPAGFGPAEFVLAEAFVVSAALLAVGLAFASAMRSAAPRAALLVALPVAALAAKTLAHGTLFGPERAFAWLTPGAYGGLAIGMLALLAASAGPVQWRPRFALVALAAALVAVNIVPANPYFLFNLQGWRQGVFMNFNELASWLSTLWPYALGIALLTHAIPARSPR
ncbi:MAG: VanZ family protein [Betaproteobacteria bacterium]